MPQKGKGRRRLSIRILGNPQLLSFLILALALISASRLRAQDKQIKLAVIGISNPSTLPKSNIGNALVDILDSDISAAGKYTLLERSQLSQLRQELNLGQSDLANAKTFAQKGGLAGADFLLLGKVSDYTYKESVSNKRSKWSIMLPQTQRAVVRYDHVATVRVDLRLVDVRTGEVVRSVSGDGSDHNTGRVSFEREWFYYVATQGQGTLSNLATLLTNASNNAIQDAVRKLNDMYGDLVNLRAKRSIDASLARIGKGKILAVIGQGRYVIGVQSTSNLRVGDRFRVIGEIAVKNSKGVVVYKEKRDAGTVQVTDISESNRAMARLVDSSARSSTTVAPRENDVIVFDMNYGRALRGMTVAGAKGGTMSTRNAARAKTYLEKGDQLLGEKEYSEALDQFKQGLQARPGDAQLLAGRSVAEAGVGDFTDAEQDGEKAIARGASIVFAIAHNHLVGFSSGNLILARGKISYQPASGDDGFTLTPSSQARFAEDNVSGLPKLVVRWKGQDGKDHKYNMVLMSFLTAGGSGGPLLSDKYHLEGGAEAKTISLGQMVVSLAKVSLP